MSLVDANGCTDNQIAAIIEPTQLLLDSTVVSASCGLANGSATVIGSGGAPIPGGNYTYQWNSSPNQTTQTAIGLATNLYNVQVTDLNGCVANTDVVVPNAAGPSVANITSYQATCFGSSTGAADVDATGGTAPLVYTWTNSNGTQLVSGPAPNDSIMGIPRGTYNVNVVDANGCFFNAVSVVAENAQLTLFVSADATVSYGDSVQVSANIGGGIPPYSWTWLHNGTSVPAYNITSGSLSTGPHQITTLLLTPYTLIRLV
ncbi:MAG: SprB repeat-containing protein [Bacteroidetes bacterium]|nr:SprB repeat-containing protein [Bacteroidota bacterium]